MIDRMSTTDADQPTADRPPRLAVIACAVMEAETEHLIDGMDHIVAYRKLEQGLHNEPDRLREQLQRAVDELEQATDAEAIALVYGLCRRGIEGITARHCRLVVTRAHDCITLLLGSRQRYAQYVAEHPGTYWYSPGWNRHHLPPGPGRYHKLRQWYVEKYGEDNADFLMETEQQWFSSYGRATYVHLTIGATDDDRRYTRDCADWLGWAYDEQIGDPALLRALLSGEWSDDDFLVIEPGCTFRLTADERIIEPAPAEEVSRG
jgi:hypothetical protein